MDGYFEPNLGQASANVQFVGRGGSGACLIGDTEAILLLRGGDRSDVARIRPVGLSKPLRFEPEGKMLPGISAYFRGSSPAAWIPRVPHYARIRARDALPGVDLVYYWTANRELEYDLILKPGVDPSHIRMRFSSHPSLDRSSGDLILHTGVGELRQKRPRVHQKVHGEIREVAASYRLTGGVTAGFDIHSHDPNLELVIDPVVRFSTFLGSSGLETFGAIATDAAGDVYLTGSAEDVANPNYGFPIENPWRTGGGIQRGAADAFVTKLRWNADLNRPVLVYSTFLGGGGADHGLAIQAAAGGAVYVAGRTSSRDFPLVKPIAATNKTTPDSDLFVAKLVLSPVSGELNLAFAARIGGSGDDRANAIAVDSSGAIAIGGVSGYIDDFPTVNALAGGGAGNGGFVLRLVPSGGDSYRFAYSTILGTEVRALALSADGACHVTGIARAGLPVVNPLPGSGSRGPTDAFVARLRFNTATNSLALDFATYLGGTGADAGNAIAFVEPSDLYVAGEASLGFPVNHPIPGNETAQGAAAAFAVRLNWNALSGALTMPVSTLLTSGGSDSATALAIGTAGVCLAGSTRRGVAGSRAFPSVNPIDAVSGGAPGDLDVFAGCLRFAGTNAAPDLAFSTLLGSSASATAGIALDAAGGVYVAGATSGARTFPNVNPLAQNGELAQGPADVFLLRLASIPGAGERTLAIRNSGGGTVSAPGLSCRANTCTLTATGSVILTALPEPGNGFAGWSGACSGAAGTCGVILDSDKTVNAGFGPLENLTVTVDGSGKGTVFGSGILCGSDCAASIPMGATVTLKAQGAFTAEFAEWSGNVCSGPNPECTFSMIPAAMVTATFTQRTLTSSGLEFIPLNPCRIVDTRTGGQGPIPPLGTRTIPIRGGSCGIPPDAAAYSLNVTAVPSGPLGYLTIWPAGTPRPLVSTLNSLDGRVKGNAAIVPAGLGGEVSAFVTDATHVILDTNGYFRYSGGAAVNTFNPVTPCRVLDTRAPNGPLGGPPLVARQAREFPVLASGCGIPAGAAAYSFNVTAIPKQTLGYLTIWPGGIPMPFVSTLNATTGTIVANAALVPASPSGTISAFATDGTDLILDINGYFGGPPANDVGGLLFYPVAPCRIADTRLPPGPLAGPSIGPLETRELNPTGTCALPAQSKAYAANATIVPRATLGYVTLWPADVVQPLASTLNALDGAITANGAILPAAAAGAINLFSTDWIDVILDVNGFFARENR